MVLDTGDAGTILRVHQFLDQWGIINGQVPEEQRPAYSLRRFVGTPTTPWATNLGGKEGGYEWLGRDCSSIGPKRFDRAYLIGHIIHLSLSMYVQ